jgi:CIC family chloride channel protein
VSALPSAETSHDNPLPRPDDVELHKLPVLTCSILVGLLAGLLGTLFQLGIRWAEAGLRVLYDRSVVAGLPSWLLPAVGSALLAWGAVALVRFLAPEASGSGIHEIEGALARLRPIRWVRVLPVKFVGGLMSLSAGLVLGREGPTVQMGGNVGAMVGRGFRMRDEEIHILVAAGAGAGIAAAFNAPLAGILFVVEEMRSRFKYGFLSVQSVIIASGAATLVLRWIMGQQSDIDMSHFSAPRLESLGLFLALGVMFGVIGFAFNATLVGTLDLYARLRGRLNMMRGLWIGAVVGVLSVLHPHLVGGGYETIPWGLKIHWQSDPGATIKLLLGIFAARFVATMFSYGCGAPGGIFAPMLALATLFGMAFGIGAERWFASLDVRAGMFAVAGMGALFAATVRAPLTGIALTIEMTQNYALILPLILTCWGATIVAQGLGARPIYSVLLERTLRLSGTRLPSQTSD